MDISLPKAESLGKPLMTQTPAPPLKQFSQSFHCKNTIPNNSGLETQLIKSVAFNVSEMEAINSRQESNNISETYSSTPPSKYGHFDEFVEEDFQNENFKKKKHIYLSSQRSSQPLISTNKNLKSPNKNVKRTKTTLKNKQSDSQHQSPQKRFRRKSEYIQPKPIHNIENKGVQSSKRIMKKLLNKSIRVRLEDHLLYIRNFHQQQKNQEKTQQQSLSKEDLSKNEHNKKLDECQASFDTFPTHLEYNIIYNELKNMGVKNLDKQLSNKNFIDKKTISDEDKRFINNGIVELGIQEGYKDQKDIQKKFDKIINLKKQVYENETDGKSNYLMQILSGKIYENKMGLSDIKKIDVAEVPGKGSELYKEAQSFLDKYYNSMLFDKKKLCDLIPEIVANDSDPGINPQLTRRNSVQLNEKIRKGLPKLDKINENDSDDDKKLSPLSKIRKTGGTQKHNDEKNEQLLQVHQSLRRVKVTQDTNKLSEYFQDYVKTRIIGNSQKKNKRNIDDFKNQSERLSKKFNQITEINKKNQSNIDVLIEDALKKFSGKQFKSSVDDKSNNHCKKNLNLKKKELSHLQINRSSNTSNNVNDIQSPWGILCKKILQDHEASLPGTARHMLKIVDRQTNDLITTGRQISARKTELENEKILEANHDKTHIKRFKSIKDYRNNISECLAIKRKQSPRKNNQSGQFGLNVALIKDKHSSETMASSYRDNYRFRSTNIDPKISKETIFGNFKSSRLNPIKQPIPRSNYLKDLLTTERIQDKQEKSVEESPSVNVNLDQVTYQDSVKINIDINPSMVNSDYGFTNTSDFVYESGSVSPYKEKNGGLKSEILNKNWSRMDSLMPVIMKGPVTCSQELNKRRSLLSAIQSYNDTRNQNFERKKRVLLANKLDKQLRDAERCELADSIKFEKEIKVVEKSTNNSIIKILGKIDSNEIESLSNLSDLKKYMKEFNARNMNKTSLVKVHGSKMMKNLILANYKSTKMEVLLDNKESDGLDVGQNYLDKAKSVNL